MFAFFVPSIFTPLEGTTLGGEQGVLESRELRAPSVADHVEMLEDEPQTGSA